MTNSISLIAPAKLNLNLYVKNKLENGYHSLESDICFLDLHEEINIELSNLNRIKLSDKSTFIIKDENLLLKTLDFLGGVNITLGLDLIRTSPDHGTGLDIAGSGTARPDSLIAAINMARKMATASLAV